MNNISSVGDMNMKKKEGRKEEKECQTAVPGSATEKEWAGLVRLDSRRVWLCCVALLADCTSLKYVSTNN